MGAEENLKTITAVYEAFGRGDVGYIVSCVTDDVDWAADTSSDGAPWYGTRRGPAGVTSFFADFGSTMAVEDFTPLSFAANDEDDVHTVVRFSAKSLETGKVATMHIHHWFHFRDGKIAYYRGSEDTVLTVDALKR
jgi:ketosteroid isomerase-like protein